MRILVVEDEVKLAALLKRGLEEEGMAVDVATDGESGYALASDVPYDAIVLDLMLPEVDGVELCRRLRRQGCATPLLMLTARDDVEARVRGLDAGADDYVTKPFAFAELTARIRALLRRTAPAPAPILQIGDLVLDRRSRRVTRAGTEIALTAKEFALLECLMLHPDEVLSRTILQEKVWDMSFETLTNVIDVYINYLRNKIDRHFEPKLIHTVRGAGYILRTPRAAEERGLPPASG